jgi:REP element-mobilizing transposase RayT
VESSVYLITFATYGSHLPGGTSIVDHNHNVPGSPYAEQYNGRLNRSKSLVCQPPFLLDQRRREIVLAAIQEACAFRQWTLLAAHVRTNHVHMVVDSPAKPEQVMTTLKAYTSRALNRFDPTPAVTGRDMEARGIYGTAEPSLPRLPTSQTAKALQWLYSVGRPLPDGRGSVSGVHQKQNRARKRAGGPEGRELFVRPEVMAGLKDFGPYCFRYHTGNSTT